MSIPARVPCRALGIEVTPVTVEELLAHLEECIRERRSTLVAGHNLHSSYLFHTDRSFRGFYEAADLVLPDGVPVLWDLKGSVRRTRAERIGSTDWLPHLGSLDGVHRIAVVGSDRATLDRYALELERTLPLAEQLAIPGADWSEVRSAIALERLREFLPDLLIIGLGMPRQEAFAMRVHRTLEIPVVATVGGAIDQLAGTQRNAPRWLGRFGLEWAWRLATQPSRLWRRYLVEPWKLLALRIAQLAGGESRA